jgi:hypothetical protein
MSAQGITSASTTNGRCGPGRPVTADTIALMDGLETIVAAMAPMSVRGAFYQASTRGLVPKTEAGYRKVQRLLVKMREAGRIPWGQITDGTRTRYRVQTFGGLDEALGDVASVYRRDLWRDAEEIVEVWLEKDALKGVISPVTKQWRVDLMVCRGYPSLSYLHEAAEYANAVGKPLTIYYLGDYDPSGQDIPRMIEERLEEFGVDFTLELLAVTTEQIANWDLPSRPTNPTDTRSKGFAVQSVELDAIEPPALRALVHHAIAPHVDQHTLNVLKQYEADERQLLWKLVNHWQDDVDDLEFDREDDS